MTIDEAIKILELDKDCEFEGSANDLEDALQLGLEALKRVKLLRTSASYPHDKLLYGETGE